MFVNKHFIYLGVYISKSNGLVMRNLRHIIMCISAEFHICISVPEKHQGFENTLHVDNKIYSNIHGKPEAIVRHSNYSLFQ